jgi:uncharacterized RDD family membrane protein YckC
VADAGAPSKEEQVSTPIDPGDEGGQPQGGYGQPPDSGQPAGGYGQPAPDYGQPPVGATALPPGVVAATLGQRLLAKLVDIAIAIVVGVVVGLASGGRAFTPEGGGINLNPLPTLLLMLIWAAYEITLIAQRGQTVGKQVVGIKVLREADGAIPGWGPATLRWVIQLAGYVLCFLPLLVIWLSPAFDNSGRQQGWHDKVAKTLVIKA